ncbi:MAG: hypothetical protein MJ014_04435, partial [Methanocorpusculum sp.]|nr:hypothetical protein [Methanocorpusculum sp.]
MGPTKNITQNGERREDSNPKKKETKTPPVNEGGIPAALRARRQWLVWRYGERDGKPTKIPADPRTLRNTDATKAVWTYDECAAAVRAHPDILAGVGVSLRDGLCAVDFDKVLDEGGRLKPDHDHMRRVVDIINSHTEISPSGTGLHILFVAHPPPECKERSRSERGEIYTHDRFMTVTGRAWGEARDVREITADEFRDVYHEIMGPAPTRGTATRIRTAAPDPATGGNDQAPTGPTTTEEKGEKAPTDEEVMSRVLSTEKGRRLWAGDTSGYPSPSEADAALLVMLAYPAKGDQAQMRRVFLKSGLGSRPKVTEREDYLTRSIANACIYAAEHPKEARKIWDEGRIKLRAGMKQPQGAGIPEPDPDVLRNVVQEFENRHMDMFMDNFHKLQPDEPDDDYIAQLILCQRMSPYIINATSICIQIIGESQTGKTTVVDSVIPLAGLLHVIIEPQTDKKGNVVKDGMRFSHPAIYSASFTDKAIYRMKDVVADNTILRIDDKDINDEFADVFKGAFKRDSPNTRICTSSTDTARVDVLNCPLNLQFIISGVTPWIVDEQTKNRTLFCKIKSSPERDERIDRLSLERHNGRGAEIDAGKYTVLWDEISKYKYTVEVNDIWYRIKMPNSRMHREKDTLITIVQALTILNHWEQGKTEYVASIEDLKEGVELFNKTMDGTTEEIDYSTMRQKLQDYAREMMTLDDDEYTVKELYNAFKARGLK